MDRTSLTRALAWAFLHDRAVLGPRSAALLLAGAVLASGCGGSGGPGLTNRDESAPILEETNEDGLYRPYFATGDMNRPRYYHKTVLSEKGNPVAIGGTDERGFSSIDSVEVFDQSRVAKDVPKPDTGTGQWIDTNFEGDVMTFANGGRLLFSANRLADGRIIVIGGAQDFLAGESIAKAEVFDPDTRTFEALDKDMLQPRFRHTSVTLTDGNILVVGGQKKDLVTVFDDLAAIFQIQRQVAVFRSLAESEVYSPKEGIFKALTLQDSTRPSNLNTPRGRTGHAIGRIAGPDRTLNSADDVVIIAGGMQTLSGQFAPRTKFLGAVGRFEAAGLSGIEFFDPISRVWTQVSNVQVPLPRLNDPYIMNLGEFNDFTLDGVKGMANLAIITHGDVDGGCPITPLQDEVILANYTGFGPAQGLQFFAVVDDSTANQSRVQGFEYYNPTIIPPLDERIGRTAAQPVALRRRMKTPSGEPSAQTWLITASGVWIFQLGPNCIYNYTAPTVRSGCVFDPYFSFPAIDLNLSARNLSSQRSEDNPLGVIGAWLNLDGDLPTGQLPVPLLNFQEQLAVNQWAQNVATNRVFHQSIPVAGVDGVIGTFDDRVLISGGGDDYLFLGGEATAPSCEILLPPGVNSDAPTD